MQPTFLPQGIESLFDETYLSSWSDNFCDIVSQTGTIPTDCSTIFSANQQSMDSVRSPPPSANQDITGIDSTLRRLTDRNQPSIANGRELKNVCLLTPEILNFTPGTWLEPEVNQNAIKKECNSPTSHKEDLNWISGMQLAKADTVLSNTGTAFTNTGTVLSNTGTVIGTAGTVFAKDHAALKNELCFASMPISVTPVVPSKSRKLTYEQNLLRKAKVVRYLEKRKRRNWSHKIRYASRKAYAENRPRIKGRFAKQEEVDALQRKLGFEGKHKSQV
eukprot:g6309.t1